MRLDARFFFPVEALKARLRAAGAAGRSGEPSPRRRIALPSTSNLRAPATLEDPFRFEDADAPG